MLILRISLIVIKCLVKIAMHTQEGFLLNSGSHLVDLCAQRDYLQGSLRIPQALGSIVLSPAPCDLIQCIRIVDRVGIRVLTP